MDQLTHQGRFSEATPGMRAKRGSHTKETCRELAALCSTRAEYARRFKQAYDLARRNGWLDEFCAHMSQIVKPTGYWTSARCHAVAKTCATRSEFQKHHSAYLAAYRNGWLDDICGHMRCCGNRHMRLVYLVVSRVRRAAYVGLTFDLDIRLKNHRVNGTDAVRSILSEPHRIFTSPAMAVEQAAATERNMIVAMRDSGYEMANISAGGGVGSGEKKWAEEMCREAALSFKTRAAFRHGNYRAYDAARRSGWLDDVCAHMPRHVRGNRRKYTKELCAQAATQFETRYSFKLAMPGAYGAAARDGWLAEICAGMPLYGRRRKG
jgi:predicted GIY-YIG superfamily endonuclease